MTTRIGNNAARKINAQERTEADLYARGVLTPESGESLEIDVICCPYCNADVHPTKYTWHLENKHNITTVEWLTTDESTRLKECESVIERGIKAYIEVGEALLIIRDQRLYRAEYKTFAEYCVSRWQFSKTHANRLIDASEVAGNLTPMGVIPENERQARALAVLEPDQQRVVWDALVEVTDGKLTTARIQEAVGYFKTALATGSIEDEHGNQYPIADIVRNGIQEQHYERQKRAITHRNNGNKSPKYPDLKVQLVSGIPAIVGFTDWQQAEQAVMELMSR